MIHPNGDGKGTGGHIDIGEACAFGLHCNAGEKIVFLGLQSIITDNCSWRDDADDIAFDQALRLFGILDLLTNRHFVALFHQTFDIAIDTVYGHTAHGNGLTLMFIARRQGNIQGFCGNDGIVLKEFVKIAHTKQ